MLLHRRVGRSPSAVVAGAVALGVAVSASGAPGEAPSPGGEPRLELVTAGAARPGRLRLEALVSSPAVRRVDFLLDGVLVASDRRFPFCAVIDAPNRANRLEAVALDGHGVAIARDSLPLAVDAGATTVSLAEVREIADGGWLEVGAAVEHPPGVAIERVDFYRDDRYVASVGAPPYRTRILRSDGAFLRAVALTDRGGVAEGIHLLGEPAAADTLSVALVELYAMVTTRSGAPVTGLARERFELLQGGEPRDIERFSEGDAVPLSLALVIDSSSSMYAAMEDAKQSARGFLERALDSGDQALLVDFDARPRLLQSRTADLDALLAGFDAIRSRGGSAIYDAILFASLQLEEADGRKALVVLTDGEDTGSRIAPGRCAELARAAGVPVFVLGVGAVDRGVPSHRRLLLEELAAATGGGVHAIRHPDDVAAAYRAIELQLRGQYLLGFSSEAPLSPAELDALTVRLADSRLRVRTILGGQVRAAD